MKVGWKHIAKILRERGQVQPYAKLRSKSRRRPKKNQIYSNLLSDITSENKQNKPQFPV